ncbi:MAG: MBL fold metallo-hydrolase [Oscillospiraceae bacterium]|nr:MBL fold metallo-hydrolase [Oscillospiraceae bacterium]
MRVTFLAHSGFLVEMPSVTLLFDWWKGELPALRPGGPLLVFASHHHEDHFKPEIFILDDGREVRFLLGKDARLSPRNRARWGVSDATAAKCVTLGGGRRLEPVPGVTVETLPSTDEGVAFLVTADGRTVFHAGDLNWWHWTGEDVSWNMQMALHFKEYTKPLQGRHIDLAMLPLDPRLGEDGFLGPRHFLELASIRHFLPMHQWEDFSFTDRFLAKFPGFAAQTIPVTANGQVFALDMG